MRRKTALFLTVIAILAFAAFPAAAKRRIIKNMEIAVSNVQYLGGGMVTVDIVDSCHDSTALAWSGSETVVVKDAQGGAAQASLSQGDNDTINMTVQNPTPKTAYTFQISHVTVGTHKRVTLVGTFKTIPGWRSGAQEQQQTDAATGKPVADKGDIYIGAMNYANKRLFIDIDTAAKRDDLIRWDKTERVTVRDTQGRNYTASIGEESAGRLNLYFVGLRSGETYKVSVGNINYDGARYSVSGEFVATEGWNYKPDEKKN